MSHPHNLIKREEKKMYQKRSQKALISVTVLPACCATKDQQPKSTKSYCHTKEALLPTNASNHNVKRLSQ